ncbi:hypothetical protein LXM94_03235 [Rhizobium sp. TRM95111]|uniref:hypothetical protein n=1 Tax=Rhizobium alarense TaxID=2846851 RepID=UPI001F2CE709|nr:hypothetical protein [Rhizobium alarense]MCF3638978.1 hypothetical protein [Rhizobium alarense]
MLPGVATTTATAGQARATPAALPIAPDAARHTVGAATLASLRAALILRLIETLHRQIQAGGHRADPMHDMIEALLDAMEPGFSDLGPAEKIERFARLLDRLPAAQRRSMEKLLQTALLALPTRMLMEAVRNPDGREARQLAAAVLQNPEFLERPAEGDHEPATQLTALQTRLSDAAARLPPQSTYATADAKTLQTLLRHYFESGAEPRMAGPERGGHLQATHGDLPAGRLQDGSVRGKAVTHRPDAGPTESRGTAAADQIRVPPRPANGAEPARAAPKNESVHALPVRPADSRAAVDGERAVDIIAPPPADAHQTLPKPIVGLIRHLLSSLTESETALLRHLFGIRPDIAVATGNEGATTDESYLLLSDLIQESDAAAEDAGRASSAIARPARPAMADVEISAETDGYQTVPTYDRDEPPAHRTQLPQASTTSEALGEEAQSRPAPGPTQETPAEQPGWLTGRSEAAAALAARELIVVGFVPYAPATEEPAEDERRADEEPENPPQDSAREDTAGQGEEDEGAAAEGEEQDPALDRKRQQVSDLVAAPDPGFVFYQKHGDYWT